MLFDYLGLMLEVPFYVFLGEGGGEGGGGGSMFFNLFGSNNWKNQSFGI